MRPFNFVRRLDGLEYRFEPDGPGRWKRTDLDLWCLRRPGQGWVIVDATGAVLGWPLRPSESTQPPEGGWQSAKGEKAYEYELVWR